MINSTGYQAALPAPPQDDGQPADPHAQELGRRLAVCVPLAVAVIALSMVPALQFTGWQWVSLVLTAPVAVWGAWPLHRAALAGLGHGAATMDTLVSLAVAASSLLVALRAVLRRSRSGSGCGCRSRSPSPPPAA